MTALTGVLRVLLCVVVSSGLQANEQAESTAASPLVAEPEKPLGRVLGNEPAPRQVTLGSYHEILKFFNHIGYTAERWQAGIREVPRIELTHIPKRWQQQSPSMPVQDKKNIFFRMVAPGILMANEKVRAERKMLLEKIHNHNAVDDEWLVALGKRYAVIDAASEAITREQLAQLTRRVDVIPPSLSLAQAAEESNWGTSRFSIEGNALFGQWDFSGQGVKPKRPRKELGNYSVARFDNPQQSIEAYLLNLNTHWAYKKLRDKRAALRRENIRPSGWELAKTLDLYSERRGDYIKSLHAIMSYNKLMPADDAYLWQKEKIVVLPTP